MKRKLWQDLVVLISLLKDLFLSHLHDLQQTILSFQNSAGDSNLRLDDFNKNTLLLKIVHFSMYVRVQIVSLANLYTGSHVLSL